MKKIAYILAGLAVIVTWSAVSLHAGQAVNVKDKGQLKQVTFIHYPAPGFEFAKGGEPGKPDKPGGGGGGKPVPQCEVTTNDSRTTYGLTGWHMLPEGLTYHVNESTVPSNLNVSDFEAAFERATSSWTQADHGQKWTYGGTTNARRASYDGVNTIAFGSAKGAIAVTTTWYWTGTGEIAETDIIFSSSLSWSITNPNPDDCGGVEGTYDVQDIATHELGHQVGLEDLYNSADKDLTMYGYGVPAELKKDTLGTGDINGAKAVAP